MQKGQISQEEIIGNVEQADRAEQSVAGICR